MRRVRQYGYVMVANHDAETLGDLDLGAWYFFPSMPNMVWQCGHDYNGHGFFGYGYRIEQCLGEECGYILEPARGALACQRWSEMDLDEMDLVVGFQDQAWVAIKTDMFD